MNAICDTTAKSETLSVKGCKVKITYAPADTDCLDAIQKLLQTCARQGTPPPDILVFLNCVR